MEPNTDLVITYGAHTLDFNTLPSASMRAMLSRGVTHYLGSEQASKVGPNSSWFEKFEKANTRKPTEDETNAQKAANLAAAIQALVEGKVGTARGPKLDPIEAEIERMAETEVWDILAAQKLCKGNKKPKDEDSFEFEDGQKFTFEELIERRKAKHGERIRAAATKKVEAAAKAREKAKAEAAKRAATATAATTEALDL